MLNPLTIKRLLSIKQNQLEMVRDRGFNIEEEKQILDCNHDNPNHLEYFIQTYQPTNSKIPFREGLSREYKNEELEVLAIYYSAPEADTSKLGVKPTSKIVDQANKIEKLRYLIIISDVDLSPKSAQLLAGIKTGKFSDKEGIITKTYHVQVFFDDQLTYNPTKHYLVPKHTALTPAEQKEYYARSHTRSNQMPILRYVDIASRLVEKDQKYKIDPIVAWYGWRPGQVIRIDRENFITDTLVEKIITYRQVSY